MRHARSSWHPHASPLDADQLGSALGLGPPDLHHRFEPHGQSLWWLDASVAIHTWPEHGLASVDDYGESGLDEHLLALGWRRVRD